MLKTSYAVLRIMILFYLIVSLSFAETTTENNRDVNFLSLADIHFDPFIACHNVIPCPLIQKLQQTDVNNWPSIFAQEDHDKPQYRLDSNYALLTSALNAAKKVATDTHVQFVVVLGDFLGHDYRRYYVKYTRDRSREGYRAFVRKTYVFLMREFAKAFPTIDVYPVVGNNDSYQADYYSYPRGDFFRNSAQLWSTLIKNKNNQAAMQKQFVVGGYYSVSLPKAENLRLIALNTNFFSYKAKGKAIDNAADEQLKWLHNELKTAQEKKEKVIILMHIPPGIDVYATLRMRLFTLIELWKSNYTLRYQAELKQFAGEILGVFAGHLHSDWFQILTFDTPGEIPSIGTPAISPIFGNNPGFKVFTYTPKSQQLVDFITYYFPLNERTRWRTEYDFNLIYMPYCRDCRLIDGMKTLQKTGDLTHFYKYFYAVSTNSQPIVTQWNPYYWCAIHAIDSKGYKVCIS